MKPKVICTIDFNINQEIIYLTSEDNTTQYALILKLKEHSPLFVFDNMICNKVILSNADDIFYSYDKEIDIVIPKTIITLLKSKKQHQFVLGYNLFINYLVLKNHI
jgi:hypothetical protein